MSGYSPAIFIPIILTWHGFLVAIFKWLVDRAMAHLDRRFAEMEENRRSDYQYSQKIEREILELKACLPQDYVRRDDWIRYGVGLEAKLDRLHAAIASLKEEING